MSSRAPDPSETQARRYLEHLGCKDIVYEPDGNVPPDFVVDGRIGVEVRRLNQNEHTTGTAAPPLVCRFSTSMLTAHCLCCRPPKAPPHRHSGRADQRARDFGGL